MKNSERAERRRVNNEVQTMLTEIIVSKNKTTLPKPLVSKHLSTITLYHPDLLPDLVPVMNEEPERIPEIIETLSTAVNTVHDMEQKFSETKGIGYHRMIKETVQSLIVHPRKPAFTW